MLHTEVEITDKTTDYDDDDDDEDDDDDNDVDGDDIGDDAAKDQLTVDDDVEGAVCTETLGISGLVDDAGLPF